MMNLSITLFRISFSTSALGSSGGGKGNSLDITLESAEGGT